MRVPCVKDPGIVFSTPSISSEGIEVDSHHQNVSKPNQKSKSKIEIKNRNDITQDADWSLVQTYPSSGFRLRKIDDSQLLARIKSLPLRIVKADRQQYQQQFSVCYYWPAHPHPSSYHIKTAVHSNLLTARTATSS